MDEPYRVDQIWLRGKKLVGSGGGYRSICNVDIQSPLVPIVECFQSDVIVFVYVFVVPYGFFFFFNA